MRGHKRLFRNFKVKVFAAACALFLWFFVVTGDEYVQTAHLPIVLINMPEGELLTEPIPETAEVLLRGAGRDLINLAGRDKRLVLDLNGRPGSRDFALNLAMIRGIPADIDVRAIQVMGPDSVHVRLDRRVLRRIPVASDIDMEAMPGYTLVGPVRLSPDSVWVEGPRGQVEALEEIHTGQDKYAHLIKDLTRPVALVNPNPAVLSLDHTQVDFSVDVQRIGERVLQNIPLRVINIPGNVRDVRVVPSNLTLTLHAGVEMLSSLKRETIVATIDYRKWRSGQPVTAFFNLPESVIYYEAKPKSFELLIE